MIDEESLVNSTPATSIS